MRYRNMKLEKNQFDQLFAFTKKRRVEYYDLQVELVNDLENKILETTGADKSLSFNDAILKVYSSFGIFGFAKFVQDKQALLEKKYYSMWLKEIIGLTKWPIFILAIILFLLCYFLVIWTDPMIATILFILFYTTQSIILFKRLKTDQKEKKLLMLQYRPPFQLPFFIIYQLGFGITLFQLNSLPASIMIFIGCVLIIANIRVTGKIREEAINTFPEAFLKESTIISVNTSPL